MNLSKQHRQFLSLVCALSLILSVIAIPAGAADTKSVTATASGTVKQGYTDYCYVYIDSTEGLAALDVTVHFDPAKVKITSAYNSVSCTLYDNVINSDNVQFSYILNGKGSSTKTRLFYFQYQVLSDAAVGETFFDITVGEAFDSTLNEVPVVGSRCKVNIAEGVYYKNCSVYGSSSTATSIGKEFTLNWSFSTYQIASGTTVINYDPELFEVVTVTQGAFLSDKLVDVNTDLSGAVQISFVGTETKNYNTNYVSVTFRTIRNETVSSPITFRATELMDSGLNPYTCKECKTTVNIAYDGAYTGDAPEMRLDGTFSYEDMKITLVVSLEAGSRLGAGDFTISFDPALVTYCSSTKGFAPSFFSVNEKNVGEGVLKFHIVSLTDIVTEETVLTVEFDVNHPYGCATADFILDGTGLTDSLTESILLDFVDDSVWLEYWVTFCDENGDVLQTGMYHYGDPVQEPEPPEKASDVYGSYTFAGWDKPVTECTGDITYTAVYNLELADYWVTFRDWDGTELYTEIYHYGESILPPAEPYRPADNTYFYYFTGWDTELVCTGDMVITAEYIPEFIEYSVVFQNWDGSILSWETYHYGDEVLVPPEPVKAADNTYTYAFAGWDSEVVPCAGDAYYTAVFTAAYIDYTVVFRDWDGTELATRSCHYGDYVQPPADPERPADHMYSYYFVGWDTELTCTGDMVITALYAPVSIEYTVRFQNWDGTLLSEGIYYYGDIVEVPGNPVKPADNTYTYTFAGWDKQVTECTGDTVYTAVFDAHYIDYTVVFRDWDGSVISSTVYHYGDTIAVPEDPQREADAICSYSFAGWNPAVSGVCTGDAAYTAVYTPHYYGFALSGTVTSFGDSGSPVSIRLLMNGVEVASTETVYGSYALLIPEPGTYTLVVSKEHHAQRTYTVTATTEAVTLDVQIHLIGDIDGNGIVNISDANKANAHVAMTKELTGYALVCADVDGNGIVDLTDVEKINAHAAKLAMLW